MIEPERPLQTPCQWCGNAITQPSRGRRLHYCDRSCRQRAYEVRTAERRLQKDLTSGRIRETPAERIVQRVVRQRHPTSVAGWADTLGELAGQLAAGRYLHPADRHAIGEAVSAVLAHLPASPAAAVTGPRVVQQQHPVDAVDAMDERVLSAIVRRLNGVGGAVSTSLTRLADDVDSPVAVVRQAVRSLAHIGGVRTQRRGLAVDVDSLTDHAKFDVVLVDDRPAPRGAS